MPADAMPVCDAGHGRRFFPLRRFGASRACDARRKTCLWRGKIRGARFTDLLTYAFAVALALSCLVFASYKVFVLSGMENPPANMGLNFPPPKRKVITDDAVEVDSMTTRSVTPAEDTEAAAVRPLQPFSRRAPVQRYKLLTVVDGVAFVELETFRGREIEAVSIGAELRDAGPVEKIERQDGRWTLIAGDERLVSERQ